MKCFFHVDRDAVSQCQVCRKGLCAEDTAKWNPPHCDKCAAASQQNAAQQQQFAQAEAERQQREHEKYQRKYGPKYLGWAIKSWVLGLMMTLFVEVMMQQGGGPVGGGEDPVQRWFPLYWTMFSVYPAGWIKWGELRRRGTFGQGRTVYVGRFSNDFWYFQFAWRVAAAGFLGLWALPQYTFLGIVSPLVRVVRGRSNEVRR